MEIKNTDCKAIVLAAGKGTRITEKDNPMPKVLRRACGRPLLSYVLDSVGFMERSDITVVVGYMHEAVMKEFENFGCRFALQGTRAYGTGYAVMCGIEAAGLQKYSGTILVLQGDVPLIRPQTIDKMLRMHSAENNACTLLSCVSNKKLPFGRIVRNEKEEVTAIVEEKDCTPEQKLIRELNVGMYIFDGAKLNKSLESLTTENSAGEYYLTDVPLLLIKGGDKVGAFITDDENELWGVNTFEDLKSVEDILRSRNI